MDTYSHELVSRLLEVDNEVCGYNRSSVNVVSQEHDVESDDPLVFFLNVLETPFGPLRDDLVATRSTSHRFIIQPYRLKQEVDKLSAGKRNLVSVPHQLLFWEIILRRVWLKVRKMAGGMHAPMLTAENIFSCLPEKFKVNYTEAAVEEFFSRTNTSIFQAEKYLASVEKYGEEWVRWEGLFSTEMVVVSYYAIASGSEEGGIDFLKRCKKLLESMPKD